MPTIFRSEAFLFAEGEEIPDHADDYPKTQDLDISLHHIEGLIPEDGDYVWLAVNLQDGQTAERMLAAAIRKKRADGGPDFDLAVVAPNFEGAYTAGENIVSAADELAA